MLNRFSCTSRIYTTRVSTAISAHISGMSNGIITNDEADVLHPAARAAPIDVSKMANPLSPELFAKLSNTPKTVELQTKVRQHVNPLSTR